jgi:hypothetical protein
MSMLRSVLLALFAVAAFAQNPADLFNKPPADVDEALRARIKEFFQYHVTQEYRKAEKLVAEDSQDFFYNHNKPHYLSFEIRTVTYSDDFTKAKVLAMCEQFVPVPGFMDKPLQVPTPSTWKVVDGQWYWYVDQKEFEKTPFGKLVGGPGGPPTGLPTTLPTTADFAMNLVKADRQAVTIKAGQSEQVTITNNSAGYMTIGIQGSVPDLEATLSSTVVKAGEKAVLKLRAGHNVRAGVLNITVLPTSELIPIKISVE